MKKLCFIFILCCLSLSARLQDVNGEIFLDTTNLHVIKVWGTCEERAYAYGYLLAEQIVDCYTGALPYYTDSLDYETMRSIILAGEDLSYDSVYIYEAMAMINGITDATGNPDSLDYIDILIGNSIEDLLHLLVENSPMQCSSLMSWGDATAGTGLDGKSVISHHLDLMPVAPLYNNNVIVVNFPSEPGTQEWLLIHFAGSLVPIDGVNRHIGVFGQAMSDYQEPINHGQGYLPYAYALRKALEQVDYNNDQAQNVLDVKAALDDCNNGFGNPEIVAVLAETQSHDSLTAMVCEIASNAPTHVYRTISYPDSIPGDNLYTANSQIARNNYMQFCSRYNGIRDHIGDGTMIGLDENWELMKQYSHLGINMQFKQYAPEADLLKLAVKKVYNVPAYMEDPYVFSLEQLFYNPTTGIESAVSGQQSAVTCYPNPTHSAIEFRVSGFEYQQVTLKIYNVQGQEVAVVLDGRCSGDQVVRWDASGLPAGIYFYRLTTNDQRLTTETGKIVKY